MVKNRMNHWNKNVKINETNIYSNGNENGNG